MSFTRISHVAAAIVIGLALVGAHPTSSVAVSSVTIRILERFDPADVRVVPGTLVIWVNESRERHRVRTTSGPARFDSGNLEPGERYAVTLAEVGTYEYRDERNTDDARLRGRIIVAAGPADPGSPEAPSSGSGSAPSSAAVGMSGRVFRPVSTTIAVGGAVTWRNDDDRDHTVTASSDGTFDSGLMRPGARWSQSFPTAGTFRYLCILHPDMVGTVVVAAPGGAAPPESAASTTEPSPVSTAAPDLPGQDAPVPAGSVAQAVSSFDFSFSPASITVAAGTTVTFVNDGMAPHTVTASDGTFDSGFMAAGASWGWTFARPGTYRYLCTLHPEMTGEVVVRAAPASAEAVVAPPVITEPRRNIASPAGAEAGTDQAFVATSIEPARAIDPGAVARLLLALVSTSVASLLFMRVVRGVVRGPAD